MHCIIYSVLQSFDLDQFSVVFKKNRTSADLKKYYLEK